MLYHSFFPIFSPTTMMMVENMGMPKKTETAIKIDLYSSSKEVPRKNTRTMIEKNTSDKRDKKMISDSF